ncbi:MAG: putative peptidoglycan lipid II flippase MurJ [Candidatus Yanofskybacteria bacterium GW2011_GWF1_44_227]|uniref:Probable lipid II flippase MurJ n=1 Tax=Candidatus Yanofskybacteria bacterium GW2011_GWE2_40_11 TaxID=1619033 RepID=A0A0G0QU59_9BACT|nr:MAG: putative peptidoglycan lipid II flippase MurJ [Candidatus Yanofskybacteria bacterium GW2011_GWE2_40_11]KKT52642.1 MAG: putative peptidoglycan lipid II flippase MurJ [Candidatus Yanofskybacteria bacterium GW2011_GWF1_44_227]OGN35421.1 MAG: murein biosynthesis integral membrane protein MurJ [Candidatus Yanofskybacteria bacterium RIFOXYA1_FULL_44_17]OGN36490.1 MAG: murein biosynthesis integral membrane protein MurJ [Candidatus Yanofskybacteria bacterium RIFOXYA2_FULL_45_28]OGN37168.1 MAG: 
MNRLTAIFKGSTGKIYQAGAILAFFSLASRLVGLLRDRILAADFGASRSLDIYYSAFKIPDFIFNLIVLGAVSSAFIPVFIESYRLDKIRAWRLAQNFLSAIACLVVVFCCLVFVFIRPLSSILMPGFAGADRELAMLLTRLMLLSPIIFSISTVVGSVLQALERFWAYALAPVFYNLGIIVGAIFFVPMLASRGINEVYGLGFGVILGATLHLSVQLPSAIHVGFRFRLIFDWADEGLRKIFRLMLPRTIGLGAYSLDAVITNAIATTMTAGSITILNLANNLQFVPISVIGISMATAVFPALSSHASGQEKRDFTYKLRDTLKKTFYIVSMLAVLMAALSYPIIKLLFGTGSFGGVNIRETAFVLSIFMIGVVAQSLVPILSRAFYAIQNTRTPVIAAIITISLNIILSLVFSFVFHWGVRGLALAFSISGNLNFLILWYLFNSKIKKI